MIELVHWISGEKITMQAIMIGTDIQVLAYGGDKPHIGAVSLAVPFERDGKVGASVSTLTALTHREDQISRQLAESFCKHFNAHVAVSCGIHFNQISKELIVQIQDEVLDMGHTLVLKLQTQKTESSMNDKKK
jgi:hypothetical protein